MPGNSRSALTFEKRGPPIGVANKDARLTREMNSVMISYGLTP